MKAYRPINFEGKFARLPEQWSPRVIAEMNDYQFKVARLEGDFVVRSLENSSPCSEINFVLTAASSIDGWSGQRGIWSGWQAHTQTATGCRFSALRDIPRGPSTWKVFDWIWAS
jgi:hypothetical protein